MPQELIKEREQPELSWVFYHVVTRHYSAATRMLRARAGGPAGDTGTVPGDSVGSGLDLGLDLPDCYSSKPAAVDSLKPMPSASGDVTLPMRIAAARPAEVGSIGSCAQRASNLGAGPGHNLNLQTNGAAPWHAAIGNQRRIYCTV